MVVASWGDSDSDVEHEERRIRCLVADDEKVSLFKNKIFLKKIVFELKKIVDTQAEQIRDREMLIEFQNESLQKGMCHMKEMRDEIEYLKSIIIKQRKLVEASKAKAEFLQTEFNPFVQTSLIKMICRDLK